MTREHLVARAQAFIDLKYVARSDARQKAMGLSYICLLYTSDAADE